MKRQRKPFLMRANEQYCLDFGQKNIEPTKCATCGMLYIVGEETDEKQHRKYHEELYQGIKWTVKTERAKKYFDDCSRIVEIIPEEPKSIQETMNKMLKLSDGEMSAGNDIAKILVDKRRFYVFVNKNNETIGYVCVEHIEKAFHLVDYEASRMEPDPVVAECGIIYLWVHPQFRRHKVATKLVDCARANLKSDKIISRTRVAVCNPTENAVPFMKAYLLHKRPVKIYD